MRLIPAIDIIGGKCVRLSQGDYDKTTIYKASPLEQAKAFEAHGIQHLHLVDLEGAKSQKIVQYKVLEELATKTNLQIDFGGGIKSDESIRIAFESGANQITGGSIAVKDPTLFSQWIQTYGSDKIILGADAKAGKIATNGWLETSEMDLIPFIQSFEAKGIEHVICTDISKDGMLQGPAIDWYQKILENSAVKLIASGGVSSLDDLYQLKEIGCEGAIIGKAYYEGKITLKALEALC